METRHFLSITDFTIKELHEILALAHKLKIDGNNHWLSDKLLVSIFQKPSLRTRLSFERAMQGLGGNFTYYNMQDIGMGKREPVKDIAQVASGMCNVIAARVFEHSDLEEMAKYSSVPIINALSDKEHPCQALADFFTIEEKKGSCKDLVFAFIGDGNNNIVHSLALGSAMLGMHFRCAAPDGYWMDKAVVAKMLEINQVTGSTLLETAYPEQAAKGADIIYTDTWISMGKEEEKEERLSKFRFYEVTESLIKQAKPEAIFMHDMPAYRGYEVAKSVIDGPQSIIYQQAKNRVYTNKAVFATLLPTIKTEETQNSQISQNNQPKLESKLTSNINNHSMLNQNHQTNYVKVASYEARKGDVKKCVLLYSGGLDTSCMLKWIKEEYACEVIALTVDVGQQADDLQEIIEKANALGAAKAIVVDAKDECAEQYLAKGIKANACYQGEYHLSTPIVRPLLAKKAVEIALQEGADSIAHGCTGKGNDQVRLDGAIITLSPDLKIIAPVREWAMGREEEIEYAKQNNIPIKQTHESPYSYDDNMWGVTGEGGEIEDPKKTPLYQNIVTAMNLPEQAPDTGVTVELEFKEGIPFALNGQQLKLASLIEKLNHIGGLYGVGLITLIEDRLVGLKVRGVYWAPGAHIITEAHKNLEKIVSTREENEFKTTVDTKWAYLCYGAKWYDPLMENLNAFIDSVNKKVTGKVKVKLFKGQATVVSVESPNSLFDADMATFNKSSAFNQNASAGFIEIYNLPAKTAWSVKRNNG